MYSNFKNIKVKIYGASHADEVGVFLTGVPLGTDISRNEIDNLLDRRRSSKSVWSTSRGEADEPIFIKGIENGKVVSEEIHIAIKNKTAKKSDYDNLIKKPRPSHADYPAMVKDGDAFLSGGGRFSGRMTAPICIAGGIAKGLLEEHGIKIGAYIAEIGGISAVSYKNQDIRYEDIEKAHSKNLSILSDSDSEITEEIVRAKEEKDSLGGIIECIVYNMPVGVGDALYDGIEGRIAQSIFAIPAVKGVEFGAGFDISKMKGSKANDAYQYKDGNVVTLTNNNGGITGGMSNGMPITLRVAIKPTPSIGVLQNTVDLESKKNTTIEIKGRHDACIVPRAVPVVEAAVALAIYDCMLDDAFV